MGSRARTRPDSAGLLCPRSSAVAFVAAVVAVLTSAAGAAQTPFRLTMEGRVVPDPRRGILHEGSFRASAPFCSSGTGADLLATGTRPTVSYRLLQLRRRQRVPDRSPGRPGGRSERPVDRAAGGSSREAGRTPSFEGWGTLTGVLLPSQSGMPAFRSTWNGVVDFDDVAPPIVVLRTRVTKRPGRPESSWPKRPSPPPTTSTATESPTA